MIERQELHCHNCSRYVQFNLDTDLDGKHVLNCPSCGHEHCRFVNKGVISDTRWDSKTTKPTNLTGYIFEAKRFIPNFIKNIFKRAKDPFRGLQISIVKDSNGIPQIFLKRKPKAKITTNVTNFVYGNASIPINLTPIGSPVPNPAAVQIQVQIQAQIVQTAQLPVYYVAASNIQCTTVSTFAMYQGTVGQGTGGNTFLYQAWMNTTGTANS